MWTSSGAIWLFIAVLILVISCNLTRVALLEWCSCINSLNIYPTGYVGLAILGSQNKWIILALVLDEVEILKYFGPAFHMYKFIVWQLRYKKHKYYKKLLLYMALNYSFHLTCLANCGKQQLFIFQVEFSQPYLEIPESEPEIWYIKNMWLNYWAIALLTIAK